MVPVQEGITQVWTLMRGGEVKYCWPRNGLSSLEVAHKRLDELKAKG